MMVYDISINLGNSYLLVNSEGDTLKRNAYSSAMVG
jgi:hypothetical protein